MKRKKSGKRQHVMRPGLFYYLVLQSHPAIHKARGSALETSWDEEMIGSGATSVWWSFRDRLPAQNTRGPTSRYHPLFLLRLSRRYHRKVSGSGYSTTASRARKHSLQLNCGGGLVVYRTYVARTHTFCPSGSGRRKSSKTSGCESRPARRHPCDLLPLSSGACSSQSCYFPSRQRSLLFPCLVCVCLVDCGCGMQTREEVRAGISRRLIPSKKHSRSPTDLKK